MQNLVKLPEPRPLPTNHDVRGRHRRQAEADRLDLLIKDLKEELDMLNTVVRVSQMCNNVFEVVDNKPDPFLPVTRGPENPTWNKWFDGRSNRKKCCCLL